MPATLFAKLSASFISNVFDKAPARAPLNASPAPVVSITGFFSLYASRKKFSLLFAK